MIFAFYFFSALISSTFFTFFVKFFAEKFGIIDIPTEPRKVHKKPVALLGGIGVFLSFWISVFFAVFLFGDLPSIYVSKNFLIGIFVSSATLMLGGFFDDKYRIRPVLQIVPPIIACLAIIASGVGVEFVTNPIGEGVVHLDLVQWHFADFFGKPLHFVLFADIFTFVWLMGMMFTTKLLDGLDGLVSGITTIGAFILFALSLTDKTYQPDVSLISIILAGAFAGFLIFNAHPAKIFLGEGGSLFAGFMLGVVAIISGGKVATALLIMGVPILDVAWVIFRRMFLERRSIGKGDSKHLHFRLLTAGLTHRQSVFLLWGLSALFGVASLFMQTQGKVYCLAVLVLVTLILGIWTTKRSKSLLDRH